MKRIVPKCKSAFYKKRPSGQQINHQMYLKFLDMGFNEAGSNRFALDILMKFFT